MYAITGASGQLGRLVLNGLLKKVPASSIIALVRDPAQLLDLAQRGVVIRHFDYNFPETLKEALDSTKRLLLISSNEIGRREAQHCAVINAAKAAGVEFIAYTSILHADTNPFELAVEHRATERALEESGLSRVLLRNGWYTENYLVGADAAIADGAIIGSTGDGLISAAERADYAAAAVAVLTSTSTESQIFELAGDTAFKLTDFAAALSEVSHKPVAYRNLSESDYRAALVAAGLPGPFAQILADSSAKAAQNVLFDDSRTLSALIQRPTTLMRDTVKRTFHV